jgi:hypothetical protein
MLEVCCGPDIKILGGVCNAIAVLIQYRDVIHLKIIHMLTNLLYLQIVLIYINIECGMN